jgi:hypothetical protein
MKYQLNGRTPVARFRYEIARQLLMFRVDDGDGRA